MAEQLLSQPERLQCMLNLAEVVRQTGEFVLQLDRNSIFDTVQVRRHQFSTVDSEAGRKMRAAIAETMDSLLGTVLEESEITAQLIESGHLAYPLLVGDAVEGSTNAKRGLAAYIRRPILSGTSAMVLEDPRLASVIASAFFDFASRSVFSSVRTEAGSFLAFLDNRIIPPSETLTTRGDSQIYAAVPGYSHGNVEARAAIERALLDGGIYTTGGTRSSAQDLLDMIGNQIDAYVDLRALFPGLTDSRDEVLHPWDVGGLLPVLDGLGFMITDVTGRNWQDFRFGDQLAIIVTRPALGQRILETIRQLPFVAPQPADQPIISFSRPPAQLQS